MEEVRGVEVGSPYRIEAEVFLGELGPEDVAVEIYGGHVDSSGRFLDRFVQPVQAVESMPDGVHRYREDFRFEEAGHFGLNIRVIPNHPNPESRHAMGLVVWGDMNDRAD